MTRREVPEWIGATADSTVPPHVRVRVFDRWGGRCWLSGRKITPADKWDLDHVVALINGGENRENNLRPALRDKHKAKTALDMAEKSNVYQKRARHLGVRSPSRFPGARGSNVKFKIDGTRVNRETGEPL